MAIRIYFRNTEKGRFDNGKEKLSVSFGEDGKENKYEWIPRWKEEIIRLFGEATETEAKNCPFSDYLNAFAEIAKKTFEKVPFGESCLRIGLIVGRKGNKIVVTKPGYIEYGLYNSGIKHIKNEKEFPVGFLPTEINKFLGKAVVLWIIDGIVIKISDSLEN